MLQHSVSRIQDCFQARPAKHCGDGSAILTDTVKDIFADGYNFILIAVAVGLIAYGAVKSVQYRIEVPVIAGKRQ